MDNKTYLSTTIDAVYKKNLANLMEVRKTLIRVFGEQNIQMIPKDINQYVDISERSTSFQELVQIHLNNEYYEITIRFPEILLTSQTRKTHTLRDLFVRFHLNQNLHFRGGFMGMRTTHTDSEYASDYSHSHLPGLAQDWSNFCTGTGPLSTILGNMRSGTFSIIDFEFLCLNIQSYVAYESISGTPYRRISNIGGSQACPQNIINSFSSQLNHIYSELIKSMSPEMIKALFKPNFDNGRIDIKITDDLEQGIAVFIQRIRSSTGLRGINDAHLFAIKKSDGTYVNPNAGGHSPSNFRSHVALRFKKEDIHTKLIGSERNTVLFAHPEITEYVCKRISRKLTRAAVTFNQAQQSRQTENLREAPARDIVSL